MALLVATGLSVMIQTKRLLVGPTGPGPAQRFARRFARNLARRSRAVLDRNHAEADARMIIDGLISYAQAGAGRPPGAITPSETGRVVFEVTGSEPLADAACTLVAGCDRVLFSSVEAEDGTSLLHHARELFHALGRGP